MGYVAYTDAEYKTPFLINPLRTVGDVSRRDATDWNHNRFYVGDVECHLSGASDFNDYSWVTSEMIQPSVTLYFQQGFSLSLTYTQDSNILATVTNYGQIVQENVVVVGGATLQINSPWPGDAAKFGFIFCRGNGVFGGISYPCLIISCGWFNPPGLYYVPFTICISIEAFEAVQTDPQGGIPIQPEGGNGRYTLGGQTLGFGTAEDRSDAMGGGGLTSGTGHGTHLYDLDLIALTDFMGTVYSGTDDLTFSDLWQAFKNSQHDPLSGILGALIIPHAPPSESIGYMRLSGQSIAVSGSCAYVTKRMGETEAAEIAVQPVYDTFLDYEPFTKISLYLPFVGMVGINTNECMGGKISVKYWIDYCTGNCVAYVALTDRFGYPSYYQYSGNCAAFIPISGNDAGISSIISGASSVISGTVSALSGNPAGVGSILAGGAVMAEPKTTQKHVGSFSGGAGCIGCLYPFIVVNAPSAATDKGYTNIMGTISALNGRVGDYGGFTAFLQVDTAGVPATDSELREIQSALAEGVYI